MGTNVTLGILGGGQLGRMSAQAAQKLGIRTIIFTPEDHSPAAQIADETILAPYEDEEALSRLAARCDFITYEFENIPVKSVQFLKKFKPVYPDEHLLAIAQDRIKEKTFLNESEIPTARWTKIQSANDIIQAGTYWKTDKIIIKTTRFGYDGKGQAFISNVNDIDQVTKAWNSLKTDTAIAEQIIDFTCEISVIIARDSTGTMHTYGPCRNEHKNHILDKTFVPANLDEEIETRALDLTKKLAEAINLRGVLALELFVTREGKILANEIAPRTHNSGHWSIEACAASQFENHVRAVCGLNLADPKRHSDCTMINLIGADIENLAPYQGNKHATIHNYGKKDVRPGRKMGHVTILEPKA